MPFDIKRLRTKEYDQREKKYFDICDWLPKFFGVMRIARLVPFVLPLVT